MSGACARGGRRLAAAALGYLVVAGFAEPAAGHTRSVSYSTWSLSERGATVRLRLAALDAQAYQAGRDARAERATPGPAARLERGFEGIPRQLHLLIGDASCEPIASSFVELADAPGWRSFEWQVDCAGRAEASGVAGGGARRAIACDLLMDVVAGHLHFARVRDLAGTGAAAELALTPARRRAVLLRTSSAGGARASGTGEDGRGPTLASYVQIGLEHIGSGWDHLAFLLVLVLGAGRFRYLALAVTGFTLGHTCSLTLAALGLAMPASVPVEALIGLSIALVAVENVWLVERGPTSRSLALPLAAAGAAGAVALLARRFGPATGAACAVPIAGVALFSACNSVLLARMRHPELLRWTTAALFGLVHGFAFAGVLEQLQLSPHRLAVALIGFNLGVELGQLLVVAVAAVALGLLRWQRPQWRVPVIQLGSAVAAGFGVYWLVSRAFG